MANHTSMDVALDPQRRKEIATLAALNLWPKSKIAEVYGVSRATIINCTKKYPDPFPIRFRR